MKNRTELAVFKQSLRRTADPGTVCSVVFVHLPESNGHLRFCVFRHFRYRQLVAGLQLLESDLLEFSNPTISQHSIELPDEIVRYIRHKLRLHDIRHVRGIVSGTEKVGRPLTVN